MAYKHGIYGIQVPTADTLPPSGVGTVPVYIGTAPVHQLTDPSSAVNVPILINSYEDGVAKIGYSDDWDTFTLCEAVFAHFKNKIQPIGPIIVINIMDPTHHSKEATASVQAVNGVGYLTDPIVLETIEIDGKINGTDYTAEYGADGRVKLTGTTLMSLTSVKYKKMDVSTVKILDVVGSNSSGARTGIEVVDLIYQTLNLIPTILAAPGWSHIKEVKEAPVTKSDDINGHWDAVVLADIDANTLHDAISWKSTNEYTDIQLKVGWPKVIHAGRTFWASTRMAVRMQQTDFDGDNVPYVSPSNKQIDITGTVLKNGTSVSFDEIQANELNAHGITTFIFRGGIWVLWGPHNANYEDSVEVDPKNVFDASIRMMRYLTNTFQKRYMHLIDGPLTHILVDTILNDAGTWLNSLIADGKLLAGTIRFNESSNPTSSMITGDFLFDIQTTTTPVAKSLTFKVQYTTSGLNALFGGES
ncbi:phage tail sheath family protein [Gorillibacterium massiliense]|uniref:phage tail sheath family protein n=1 Tax=Gorillibacterium massiliense TaxID=1280390 RepID=UPI0004AD20FD|nr:hypothetical protein [Gorillibacterium massiliense]